MKLGAITDGISRDYEYALQQMQRYGLKYPELQYVWEKEIGDHSEEELERIRTLTEQYGMTISVISRQTFMGMQTMATQPDSPSYQAHFQALLRTMDTARRLHVKTVRTMTFSKTVNIWGYDGADRWMAGNNQTWSHFLKLYEPIVQAAEDHDIQLVMETGTNAMVCSGYLAKRLITDLQTKHLKVLWDPANTLCCSDIPFPEAYEQIRAVLGHVHIKDIVVKPNQATVRACPIGTGGMGRYLPDIARALREDHYDGAISMELIYRPESGSFEDGYAMQVEKFKELFA